MKFLKFGILFFALNLSIASCDNDGPVEEAVEEHGEWAEDAGEKIDDAVEEAGDGIEETAEDIKDGTKEAAEEVEETFSGKQ